MKTMTCRQLGGACDQGFQAATFEDMAELSRHHSMAMADSEDAAHIAAMAAMRRLMDDPGAVARWMEEQRNAFEALQDDSLGSAIP